MWKVYLISIDQSPPTSHIMARSVPDVARNRSRFSSAGRSYVAFLALQNMISSASREIGCGHHGFPGML